MIERRDLAGEVIDALKATYDATFENGLDRRDLTVQPADLRLRMITRVWALGGLAIRRRRWPMVRRLAEHLPPAYDSDYWSNWLYRPGVGGSRQPLALKLDRPGDRTPPPA